MRQITRRSLLQSSAGLVAGAVLARPFVANAAAKTATVWWVQGFAQEEDVAFKKIVADYEKASGNTIDYSLVPYAPHRQKVVSAMTSGEVPDMFPANPAEIGALFAWQGKLVDVSDVVETQKAQYNDTALLSAQFYNNKTKQRSFYGVPEVGATLPFHIWNSLVEKAGFKLADAPKTWDAFWDFFEPVQDNLRKQGMRSVYAQGLQVTSNGVDPNNTFHYFLIAYGGKDLLTRDGRLHLDDPQVKEAVIKALTYPTTAYKQGYVPPGAINWNDADDNNALHSKLMVMDIDGTISSEVAIINNKEDYDDLVTMGLPHSNDGKPIPQSEHRRRRSDPEGGKERRRGQGLPEILDPAGGYERTVEGGPGPQRPGDAVDRQERPVVVRRPASQGLCRASLVGPDRAGLLGFQPGLYEAEGDAGLLPCSAPNDRGRWRRRCRDAGGSNRSPRAV